MEIDCYNLWSVFKQNSYMIRQPGILCYPAACHVACTSPNIKGTPKIQIPPFPIRRITAASATPSSAAKTM